MVLLTDKSSRTSGPKKPAKKRALRPQSLPSPALCCACGLCIMLAGINITLVGVFAFGTFVPTSNPPIVIGPLLLLLALSFFTACCVCSRRPPAHASRTAKGADSWGLMKMAGGATFEMETSEHTLQDTTAVQLSPTNSPSTSHKSSSTQGDKDARSSREHEDRPATTAETSVNDDNLDDPKLTSGQEGHASEVVS